MGLIYPHWKADERDLPETLLTLLSHQALQPHPVEVITMAMVQIIYP